MASTSGFRHPLPVSAVDFYTAYTTLPGEHGRAYPMSVFVERGKIVSCDTANAEDRDDIHDLYLDLAHEAELRNFRSLAAF